MKIIAQGVRGIRDLTHGKQYTALYGIEEGIFACRPFVTVIDDVGKEYSCHASRFTNLDGVELSWKDVKKS